MKFNLEHPKQIMKAEVLEMKIKTGTTIDLQTSTCLMLYIRTVLNCLFIFNSSQPQLSYVAS